MITEPDVVLGIHGWIEAIEYQARRSENSMLFGRSDVAPYQEQLLAWALGPCWTNTLRDRLMSGRLLIENITARLDKACARNTGLLWGFIDLVWTNIPLEFDIRRLSPWRLFIEQGLFAQKFLSLSSQDSSVERYLRHWDFACDQGIRTYGFKAEGYAFMAWHPPAEAMVELMVQVLSTPVFLRNPSLANGQASSDMTNRAEWLETAQSVQPEWCRCMQNTYGVCELLYGELSYVESKRSRAFRQYCDAMMQEVQHRFEPRAIVLPKDMVV